MMDEEWWRRWLERARRDPLLDVETEHAALDKLKGVHAIAWEEYRSQQPERCPVTHRIAVPSANDGDHYVTCDDCGQRLFIAWAELKVRP